MHTYAHLCTLMQTYDDISLNLLRMRYILFEICTEIKKKLHSIIFIYENRALHGVIWKKYGKPDGPQMAVLK